MKNRLKKPSFQKRLRSYNLRTEIYKEYLLRCQELSGNDSYDPECWESKEYYFDTEEEMIEFVKQKFKCNFRIEVAFKLNKLSNNIFV